MAQKLLTESQDEMRKELKKIYLETQKPIMEMAYDIGISGACLIKFFNGRNVNVVILLKLENWLQKRAHDGRQV